jgi:hypothetical protein
MCELNNRIYTLPSHTISYVLCSKYVNITILFRECVNQLYKICHQYEHLSCGTKLNIFTSEDITSPENMQILEGTGIVLLATTHRQALGFTQPQFQDVMRIPFSE